VGIRYNVIRVYTLFWWTKSKTTKIFGLNKFSTEEGLAVGILRVLHSAIKVVWWIGK